jgi:hypothetical protein
MAAKEYSKGDVIGIFGRTISSAVAVSGACVYIASRAFSRVIYSFFWIAGRNVDLATTSRRLKKSKSGKKRGSDVSSDTGKSGEKEELLSSPEERETGSVRRDRLTDELNLIRQALDYSQETYARQMLPVEEVIKIDNQAFMMAKAVRNHLKNNCNSRFTDTKLKIAEELMTISSLFQKYHSTDNMKYLKKTKKMFTQ